MTDKNTIENHLQTLGLLPKQAAVTVLFDKGSVGIIIDLGQAAADVDPVNLRAPLEDAIRQLDGVTEVSVIFTKERSPQAGKAQGLKKAPASPAPKSKAAPTPASTLPGVKHIVAVASGKGGVGKSTSAVNLALALNELGHKVGLLDADIFGPSLPKLLNHTPSGRPPIVDGVIQPVMINGMKTMSIGYMVDENQPVVWRGPKVMGAINQLFRDVDWSGTDILILDLPPGTGDVQLSIAQTVRLSGAIIITTPQDLALLDAKKGVKMFEMVGIPIKGVIENMSHFVCPSCGETTAIFGNSHGDSYAETLGASLIGQIPLHLSLRSDLTDNKNETAFMMQPADSLAPDAMAIRNAYMAIAGRLETAL